MGHVRVPILIANPVDRSRRVLIESALVDTGATWTTIPRGLVSELGLEITGEQLARSAAGPVKIDQSYAFVELEGRSMVSPLWISDSYPGVLIGVITLEGLGFAVDPGTGKLVNSELLLL
jgi:aspartyl protease family protein